MHTPPPMRFSELVESQLEPEWFRLSSGCLNLKKLSSEFGELPRIDELNIFIEANIPVLRERIKSLPDKTRPEGGRSSTRCFWMHLRG